MVERADLSLIGQLLNLGAIGNLEIIWSKQYLHAGVILTVFLLSVHQPWLEELLPYQIGGKVMARVAKGAGTWGV